MVEYISTSSSDIQARTNMQASPVKYSLILDFTMRGW